MDYVGKYPGKIRYYKNATDIGDKNFYRCLSLGTGSLLKLCNDSIIWSENSLEEILEVMDLCIDSQPVLFFLNGNSFTNDSSTVCLGHDSFVKHVSYFETWIGSFSIWRNHLNDLVDFDRYSNLKLVQVDVLHRLIEEGYPIISLNKKYFSVQDVGSKGGYSLSKVFGLNYLNILSEYCHSISDGTLYELRKRVLSELIIPYQLNENHKFEKENFERYLFHFANDDFYQEQLSRLGNKKSNVAKDVRVEIKEQWRLKNSHNETVMGKEFDIAKVSVGKRTYGPLQVWAWGSSNEKLIIGNFVSIAEDVKFLLGGNHEYNRVSTYPFKVKYFSHKCEATSKGEIIVGDDVWIGHGCMILSGVRIGQGSIIAAGSVVVKDVPPYTIYGGAPAVFIKNRFDDPNISEALSQVNFSDIDDQFIIKNQNLFTEELNLDSAKILVRKLEIHKTGSHFHAKED